MLFDAQAAFSFVVEQGSRIEPTVYATRYPAIRYPELVPVDTTGPEWISSIAYFSSDTVGQANWHNARASDVPNVELTRNKSETTVEMAALGYEWTMDEVAKAMFYGINLTADKATAARRRAEEMIDRVAILGDNAKGFKGLVNQDGIHTDMAPAHLGAGTVDDDLVLVNGAITGVWLDSNTVEQADTLLLPNSSLIALGTRRISDLSMVTVLEWLKQNNAYTLETGRPLTIRGLRGLEDAGAGGTGRMVAYRRDPEVLKLAMPMPFRFFPAREKGAFGFSIPGAFRIGGVDVRLPGAFRYVDGVTA